MPQYLNTFQKFLQNITSECISLQSCENGTVIHFNSIELTLIPEGLIIDEHHAPDNLPDSLLNIAGILFRIEQVLKCCFQENYSLTGIRSKIEAEQIFLENDTVLNVEFKFTIFSEDGSIQDVMITKIPLISIETLNTDEQNWQTLLSSWQEAIEQLLKENETYHIFSLNFETKEICQDAIDEGLEDFLQSLPIYNEEFIQQTRSICDQIATQFQSVEQKYNQIYKLKLPHDTAHLAALIRILGTLPIDPPSPYSMFESGNAWRRGCQWIEMATRFGPTGILDWFKDNGLNPQIVDQLDIRLDNRFYCDAPNFVTIASGDSDGSHWGFWYDSSKFYPEIAHNYARDSAETILVATSITNLIETILSENNEDYEDYEDEDYEIQVKRVRAVVKHCYELIKQNIPLREEYHSPYQKTKGSPIGSPQLSIDPNFGEIPAHLFQHQLDTKNLQLWITEAKEELRKNKPAYAYALGLYLHWLSEEKLRDESGELFVNALQAMDEHPLANILKVHLENRNLRSVEVLVFQD